MPYHFCVYNSAFSFLYICCAVLSANSALDSVYSPLLRFFLLFSSFWTNTHTNMHNYRHSYAHAHAYALWHLFLVSIVSARAVTAEIRRTRDREPCEREHRMTSPRYMLLLFVYKSLRFLSVYGIPLTTCGSTQCFCISIHFDFEYFWQAWHFQEISAHFCDGRKNMCWIIVEIVSNV